MVSLEAPRGAGNSTGQGLVNSYIRRLVAALLTVPGQRRHLALCGRRTLAVLVEERDWVVVHWTGHALADLPDRFASLKAAHHAIEATASCTISLQPLADA